MMKLKHWFAAASMAVGLLVMQPASALECDCEHEAGLTTSSWVKKFRINGDFRTRWEYFSNIDRNDRDYRNRVQVRARLNTAVDICDWVQLNFRLVTETEEANKATDTHRTLTGKFGTFDVGFDRAYATFYNPMYEYGAFHFGKVRNFAYQPEFASNMLFDEDLNPEGFAVTFDYAMDEDWSFFGHGSFYYISERTGVGSANDDVWMWVIDLGAKYMQDWYDGALAFTYYGTTNLNRVGPVALGVGNRVTGGSNYLDNFHVVALQGEANFNLGEEEIAYTPNVIRVLGAWVFNVADGYKAGGFDDRMGYTAQIVYGRAHNPWTWELGLQYKWLEADAVIDCFTDNEWGYGGTDRKGWIVDGRFAVCSWWFFGFEAAFTSKISTRSGANAIPGQNGTWLSHILFDTDVYF